METVIAKTVKLADVIPDENQPRRYFDPTKLAVLRKSMESYGILEPLVLEDLGNGKYLIEDGERRWRTATELGMKEVPAIIVSVKSDTERLVRQFNIQEQHEGWTPIEKANALIVLANKMGSPLREAIDMAGTTKQDRERYMAFAQLTARETYTKSEIPLTYARQMLATRRLAKKLTVEVLEKVWPPEYDTLIEERFIDLVKKGVIDRDMMFTELKDAFSKNPALIKKFIQDKSTTPDSLFIEAKAKGARYLRQAVVMSGYVQSSAKRFMEIQDLKPTKDQLIKLRSCRKALDQIIEAFDLGGEE